MAGAIARWLERGYEWLLARIIPRPRRAYLAVGTWHHWLLTKDSGFVEAMWPVVGRAIPAPIASLGAAFLPKPLSRNALEEAFQRAYESVFGRRISNVPIELVNLHLFARGLLLRVLGAAAGEDQRQEREDAAHAPLSLRAT